MTQELRRLAEAYLMEYDPMGKSRKENLQRCLNYNAFHAAANPTAILSLLDRLEKAEKDAERYRWLKSNQLDFEKMGRHSTYATKLWNAIGRKDDWDAAIDAAMEASK